MKRMLEVKRTRDGLVLKIDAQADFELILSQLDELLQENAEFYRAHRIIGTRGRTLTYAQKAQLDERLLAVLGSYADSLETMEETPKKEAAEDAEAVRARLYREFQDRIDKEFIPRMHQLEQELNQAKQAMAASLTPGASGKESDVRIQHGTMRSGSRIEHDGHVIVIGDINAGAEVIASGNIICTGKALGLVHAGSTGDESSFVLAFHLAPIQIRISKFVSGPPSGKKYKPNNYPEMAKLEDGLVRIVGV